MNCFTGSNISLPTAKTDHIIKMIKTKTGALRIYVVEDDPWYREFIGHILSLNPEFEVRKFETGTELLEHLHEQPDIVTVDYHLPDMDGSAIIKKIKAFNPEIETLVISQQGKIDTAVELIKLGVYDYFIKSDDIKEKLLHVIGNIAKNKTLKTRIHHLEEEVHSKYKFHTSIIGRSEPLLKIFSLLEKAAETDIPVLVSGETGTGKEIAAKAIHYNSRRKAEPMITVNMAAIPKDLAESELFGHEKGAFTGAVNSRAGKFEQAAKGTIFLDEIAEMDINIQAKLLRVLQEKEFTRIGGSKVIFANFRIISATNKNLIEEVKKGNFREDLYYRIYGLPVHMPPLRKRGNDIVLLASHLLEAFSKENNLGRKILTPDASRKLLSYHFPGNIRELKSVIELAAVMTDGNEIKASDISLNEHESLLDILEKEQTMNEYVNQILKYYLKKYDDNVLLVSRKLNLGKSTIYKTIKENKTFFSSVE
jgi:two-component system response regulator AtoC